ncbi:MAG: FliM/FliN family flagellar motor switch protein [Ghiorsea sp.]
MTVEVTEQTDQQEPILAPEEIDALMQAVAPSEQAHALLATLPPVEQPENIEDFDFASGSDNGPERYPLLSNLQERMAESFKEQWTETFRRDVTLSGAGIEERLYQDIINSNEETKNAFFVYDVAGFGRMMVTCELSLIIAYIDAMLGGTGEIFGAEEDLTPVEERLATRIATSFESLLAEMWEPVSEMNFALSKIETEPQFLAVAGATDACFSVNFEIKLSDDLSGNLTLHYPRTFLEPILDSLRASGADEPMNKDTEWEEALQKSIEQVPLTLRLELGQCHLNIKQFLELRSGDFLPLSKGESEPSTLWVSSSPMFEAMPGSQDGQLAAELTSKIAQD